MINSFISAAWPILVWLWTQYAKSPAEWTTALLLLGTLFYQRAHNKVNLRIDLSTHMRHTGRKLALGEYEKRKYYNFILANVGDKPVKILEMGFKTWDGKEHRQRHTRYPSEVTLLEPDLLWRIETAPYDNDEVTPELSEIYYFYFLDTRGNKYKKYTRHPFVSRVIRFIYLQRDWRNVIRKFFEQPASLPIEKISTAFKITPSMMREKLREMISKRPK